MKYVLGTRKRILVGEAEPDARALVSLALLDEGYAVAEVACGFELLEAVLDAWEGRRPPIDLVLSEPFLGCYQAEEVLEELRGLGWSGLFLVLDWGDDPELRRRIRRLGGQVLAAEGDLDLGLLAARVDELLAPDLVLVE